MSGVLVIALENATKVLKLLVESSKEYVALMELHRAVDRSSIIDVVNMFVGEIYQKPPIRSSVKRVLRVRRVNSIDILEIHNDRYVLMKVNTEPGTYIRKLCHDIGLVLGVGAHMKELRRIASGIFNEKLNLVTMHQLSEAVYLYEKHGDESLLRRYILPVEFAVAHLPKIIIRASAVDAIANGARLAVPGVSYVNDSVARGSRVAILTTKGELVAIGVAQMGAEEIIAADKGIAVNPTRVIMKPGVYPPLWRRKKESSEEI